jgi:uncharacterized membrane protein YvlD (DUF360 family)
LTYLRALFFNFLVVFFVDRVMPGVQIATFEQVPNIGADILFSLILGFLNASVFYFLSLLELSITHLRLALTTAIISFGGFLTIALVPFGVQVTGFTGFLLGGGLVWLVAYVTGYLEWKQAQKI